MEIKINFSSVENVTSNLDKLQESLTVKDPSVSSCLANMKESSGEVCDRVNEIHQLLLGIEGALSQLIQVTKLCVENGKLKAIQTDTDEAKSYTVKPIVNPLDIFNK